MTIHLSDLANLQYADEWMATISMEVAGSPFTYNPADTSPTTLAVGAILAANPDLPVADYVAPSLVPLSVTRAQAKIQLHRAGLLDAVIAAVAGDAETKLWYDEALTWRRADPRIATLGSGLGLSSSQIDALFIAAEAIV